MAIISSKHMINHFESAEDPSPFSLFVDGTFRVVPQVPNVYQMVTILIGYESQVLYTVYKWQTIRPRV